jgi:PAS domain S-box-containing protein
MRQIILEIKELNHTLQRFSYLIANMKEGVLVEDEHRRISLVNQRFCDMFSIPVAPELLVGADCTDSAEQSKGLFSDPESFVAEIQATLIMKKPVNDRILLLKDGRVFSRDYMPIIIDGTYRGHYWKYSDITLQREYENALKKSEEKYRLLIENMNLGLLEVDLEGRIIYANHSFCTMSGFNREEIYGKVAEEIFAEESHRKIVKDKTESRKTGAVDAYELEITNKSGEKKWWMISGAALHDKHGRQIGSTGIHLDITQQKQLEFKLRDAKQLAEDTAKAKEIFLANMSHEIRTPMNAILGLGKMLIDTGLTPYQNSFMESINTAAENLLIIINDILDFSKIESGKLHLESIDFSLQDLIGQVSKMMELKTREKGLSFHTNVDSGIAPYLLGDPFRLNQILLNLLSNSTKFTDNGSISVTCSLIKSIQDKQEIEIVVSDTGMGIDAEYQKNIFQKFSQENASVARKYGGTGLGFAITKQLVDLMDGSIRIESTKGIGTSVFIRLVLPIGQRKQNKEDSIFDDAKDRLKGKRVLLVDDNKVNRMIAKAILVKGGLEITEVVNGEEAVEMVRNAVFDLVLMDIQMPIMDGLTATKIIRAEVNNKVPIIALTAHALKTEMDHCFEIGMNDFISKPIEASKLLKMIAKHIQ